MILGQHSVDKAYLSYLPDEVIQHILHFCKPCDILNVQIVCQRLRRIGSEPLLWRHFCWKGFRYWDAKHRIQQRIFDPIECVDWKALYRYRVEVDSKTTYMLDSILRSQVDRISKYYAIAEFGYDAKDTLLRHCRVNECAPDFLARRYYAKSILDYLHRTKALEEWQSILDGKNIPLERALGSFDFFVLHDRFGDLSEITQMLDDMAKSLRTECPGVDQLPTKAKAFATSAFLRRRNIISNNSDRASEDLQKNYIGIVLQDSAPGTISLITAAIYCALGQRIGLDVRVCSVIGYTLAMVFPQPGEITRTTEIINEEQDGRPIYLDPARSMEELTLLSLQKILSEVGIRSQFHDKYLSEITIPNVILRSSSAITTSVHQIRARITSMQSDGHSTTSLPGSIFTDIEDAQYSATWADFMFSSHFRHMIRPPRRHLISSILQKFEKLYPMDGSSIEKYILPLYSNIRSPAHNQIVEALNIVRAADQTPKQVRFRGPQVSHRIKFKIGQVFRHRRYYYTAVIIGWELEDIINPDRSNHGDYVSRSLGTHQNFYHALVEDTSIRYVAEENIEIVEPQLPVTLMSMAGKYFKRWDTESHTFVSGIKDEYPDD